MAALRVQQLLSSVTEQQLSRSAVSFTVPAGDCLCIDGPSGVGKSLLLRALADLDESRGQVWLDDTERNELPAWEWRRRVAYLPAESAWWHDHVDAHFAQPDPDGLTALGLDAAVWERRVDDLSTGERQRVAILRLLAMQPGALLLDEPTAALDARTTQRVERHIAAYRKRHAAAVIWVSHDAAQRRRLGGRQLRFSGGKFVAHRPTTSRT